MRWPQNLKLGGFLKAELSKPHFERRTLWRTTLECDRRRPIEISRVLLGPPLLRFRVLRAFASWPLRVVSLRKLLAKSPGQSRGCQMWLSNAFGRQPIAENPLILLVIPAGVEPAFPT